MGLAEAYCEVLFKHHGKMIVGWAFVVLLGAPMAGLFVQNCTDVFEAPDGSPAAVAKQMLLDGGAKVANLLSAAWVVV
jgi:hypothetical protein